MKMRKTARTIENSEEQGSLIAKHATKYLMKVQTKINDGT